ncbi:hypothetical protein DP157_21040 [Klebsiella michiganensis]|nr:hypothetical protein [Klebsiella michiganensis]MBX4799605.1 hypothetical protein [Klebsiella michiganensis]
MKRLYPSYFKLHVRWLSSLTPVTYFSKLLGIPCAAAFMQLEIFRVYSISDVQICEIENVRCLNLKM